VADLAAREEGLQTVVGGARQNHAAQDLPALVVRERRADRLAPDESVARVYDRLFLVPQPRSRGNAGTRFAGPARNRNLKRFAQRHAQRLPQRFDRLRL
jgi:hypothetical protein